MVQCPECGNFDSMGLGFCTICGKVLPKPTADAGRYSDASYSEVTNGKVNDGQEAKSRFLSGLMSVVLMGLFMLIYLVMNDTDPLLILMVESFPILWFLLILVQWHMYKGKSGNS